jgi:hypothetical protein
MEAQFTLTGLDKNTVTYDLGGGASPAESSFYAAGYGDFIAIEHHTMKSFGVKYAPVSAVTINGQTFTTDEDAVKAINALDIFPEHYVVDSSDPRVDGILEVIPATATPDNKLVDRNTLNSSISSMAANKVEYNSAGDAFPTKAALLAATTFYRKGVAYVPTDRDYLSVTADESAPAPFTNGQTRYVFDGAVWAYDMGVNEEPFTADEVAAIQSGISPEKVAKYDAALTGGAKTFAIAIPPTDGTKEFVVFENDRVQISSVITKGTVAITYGHKVKNKSTNIIYLNIRGLQVSSSGGSTGIMTVSDTAIAPNTEFNTTETSARVFQNILISTFGAIGGSPLDMVRFEALPEYHYDYQAVIVTPISL